jgi:hypothetical protein
MSKLDGQPEEEVTEAPEIVKPKPTTVIEGELVKPADPNQADLDRLAPGGSRQTRKTGVQSRAIRQRKCRRSIRRNVYTRAFLRTR